jgi:hypothetical protein
MDMRRQTSPATAETGRACAPVPPLFFTPFYIDFARENLS